MSVETLQELLVDELKDLYSAEKQIVKALPKLARAACTTELHDALMTFPRTFLQGRIPSK
jgi:ferritin-like metal-binding protein YciE